MTRFSILFIVCKLFYKIYHMVQMFVPHNNTSINYYPYANSIALKTQHNSNHSSKWHVPRSIVFRPWTMCQDHVLTCIDSWWQLSLDRNAVSLLWSEWMNHKLYCIFVCICKCIVRLVVSIYGSKFEGSGFESRLRPSVDIRFLLGFFKFSVKTRN